MQIEYITMAAILLLSIFGHNMTVAYAAGIVLILKVLGFDFMLNTLGNQGINWGIVILTAAILVPIANGTITIHTMIDAFKTHIGLIAVSAGLFAAIAGGSGVNLLKSSPDVIPALIIGTMAGVIFFQGVAVGPLIAAGITYFILQIVNYFR
ncbi:MAG: DUF441 domain-containing protein [Selenomonadaceae bacterium]|nr:DUF441 domain-containing protein [Selenomonadaceae bacterium]